MGALSVLMIYVIVYSIPIPKQYILIKHKMYISAMEKTDVFIICCLLKQESSSLAIYKYNLLALLFWYIFLKLWINIHYAVLHKYLPTLYWIKTNKFLDRT